MPKLDFSQQAEPAPSTLDFSGAAEPVTTVSPAAMAGRQFVGGGGDLLNTISAASRAFVPKGALADFIVSHSADPARAAELLGFDPAGAAAQAAHAYADLSPNEVPDGLGAQVAGGVARVIPNIAGALATGGGASAEALVPEAVSKVPVLGRALLAMGRGAPTAAAMTAEQSANLPDDLTTLQKIEATGKNAGINLALAGLPVAVGSGPLVRTATGGALGAAIPAGTAALSGQPQDVANNIVGALTGALMAQGGAHGATEPVDPFLDAYRQSVSEAPSAPLALPRGADFSAKAEPVRPAPVDLGGAVHVDTAGGAATPAQGMNAFADAIAARTQVAPALPEPVVAVDRSGNAATSADQNTAISQIQQAIAARQRAAADRQALGITPDIERSQGVRWSKQQQAAQVEAERQARLGELDKSIATREAQNVPARGNNAKPDETVDDAMTFLAKKGGLDRRAFVKEGLDPAAAKAMENRTRGGASRPLFKAQDKGGMSLDHAAETLWQHGYLPEQDNNAALDMILGGVNQDQKAYSIHRQDQGDLLAMKQARNDAATHPADDFADVPFSRKPANFDFSNPGGAGKDGQHAREVTIGDTTITYGVGRNGVVSVDHVATPRAKRGQGSARAAMEALAEQADRDGMSLALTPEPMDKGVSKQGLSDFYRSLGFRSNKGRSIDFTTRHSMIRPPKDRAAFSFAGERAHTADRGALAQAQQMEAMGRDSVPDRFGNQPGSPEDTHIATGWHRGVDGKWKFEIDDSKAKLDGSKLLAMEDATDYKGSTATVGDVLKHDALFAAYPDLAGVRVTVDKNMRGLGAYNAAMNEIHLRAPTDYAERGDGSLKSVLLHEIQHAIQDHEGFARGGNSTEARKMPEFEQELRQQMEANDGELPAWESVKPSQPDEVAAARAVYKRLAGEVEARNTQRRLPMDAAQRRATPPSETADTPRSRQIVRFNADRAERSGPNDQDAQAIATYNAKLSDYIGQPIELTPAAHVPDATRRALAAFDDAFGSHTIVVHNGTPDALDFNGVTLRDGVRLVNEDATSPLLTVAGHEMVHQLRKDAPELYRELEAEVRRQGRLDAYGAELNARARASGEGRDVDPRVVAEELTADATGDALSDPEFIERLAKQNPSLFRQLADRLKAFFDGLVRKLRGLGSSKYMDDVEAFRSKLADVLERYAEGHQAKREPMAASEETSLSRKPAEDQTDTPAFRKLATELPKSVVDRLDGHAKALSDLLQNPPFSTKSPGFMNVPSAVVRHMLGVTENPEILGAVVRAIPVDVVNFLARKKITPEHLLSDETVLKDVLSVNGKTPVSLDINESASIVRVVAKTATELADLARGSLKASPAGKTINSDSILGAHAANDVTKTAAFSRWFGDSKVVDAEGRPLVVYHGSPTAGFSHFDAGKLGSATGNDGFFGSGFYFTDSPSIASGYAGAWERAEGRAKTLQTYLAISRPLRLSENERSYKRALNKSRKTLLGLNGWTDKEREMIAEPELDFISDAISRIGGKRFREVVEANGYDGVHVDGSYGSMNADEWVAFRPEQIKSATGNNGEFSPDNPSILFSRKPTDDADYLQDMPSRRPGESQAAYLRRVTRKNGADIKAATALVTQQRQLGRHALRGMMATQARQSAIADAALRQARKTFDETPDVINYASVHEWETGKPITDPDFRHFVATMQDGFDQRVAAIQKLAPGALQSLIENYMPHLYEDSGKALKWYQNVLGKRPLEGDKSFLKQRTWPTLKEAMASGLKPISPNPVDWVLMKYHQMDKFIGLLQLKEDFARRGWLMKLEAGQRAPEGFTRVDDPAFQIAGGLQGYYAVPELIAKDINNYLAPGLSKYGAWRSVRAVQNAMVSWNLGWSAFHAGFTSIDNAVTHGAVGLQRLVDGDIAGGLMALVKAVPTMLTSPFEGGKLNKQWTGQAATDVHTAALLDLLEQGGARMKMGNASAEYNNALPQVLRTLRRMKASGYAADQLEALQRRLMAEPAKELARTGWGALTGVGKVVSAIGEVGSFLIHHVLVPNQKMAARVTLLKFELDHYAKQLGKQRGDYAGIISVMHPDVARQLASDVVDKVDFRLGQMTYDNFFYPKIAREAAQMLVMAPGWQAGAYQTMTGGIRDVARLAKPEKLVAPLDKAGTITDAHRGRFTNNLANLIMLFVMVGGGNALWQYLVSGKEPDSMKDLVAPRTGRKNADDSDERVVLPSYMKDHWEFFHHPLAMASHKLHPAWRLMWEIGHNEDYFGNMIRDPHHPLGAQAKELAGYLAKSMLPFSATNVAKVRENGGGAGEHVANFVGITPASASLARSEFQAFVAKGGERGWDGPAQTPTQAEYSNRMRKAENALRTGQTPDMDGLTVQDVAKLQRRVKTLKPEMQFDRLSLADKLDAYALATPAERTRYHLTEILSRTNPGHSIAFRRLPDEEKQALLKQLARIRQEATP